MSVTYLALAFLSSFLEYNICKYVQAYFEGCSCISF